MTSVFDTRDAGNDIGLLTAMWAYRWSILLFVVLSGVGGYLLSSTQEPTYAGTARLVLDDPRDPGLLGLRDETRYIDPERYFPQEAERLGSARVLEAAIQTLGEADLTVDRLDEIVGTDAVIPLNTIEATATLPDPQDAARYANAVAEAYEQVAAEDVEEEAARAIEALQEQIVALRSEAQAEEQAAAAAPDNPVSAARASVLAERIVALEGRAGDVAAEAAVRGSGVDAFVPAEVPEEPAAPLPVRDTAIALFLAGVLSALFAYRRALSDERVRSAGRVAELLGVPLLGAIPRSRKMLRTDTPTSVTPAAAEAFRFVLASIEYQLSEAERASVLITSASAGDGKSTSALQLSLALARQGREVTLVDGDFRARGVTAALRAENFLGLTEALAGTSDVESVRRRFRIDDDTVLPVVTAGDGNGEPWTARRKEAVRTMAEIRDMSDRVIVDAPPILAVAEAMLMASSVDGIVLVVSSGVSKSQLGRLRERLAFVPTPVLGFVFNRSDNGADPYAYHYPRVDRATSQRRWRARSIAGAPPRSRATRTAAPTADPRAEEPLQRAAVSHEPGRDR